MEDITNVCYYLLTLLQSIKSMYKLSINKINIFFYELNKKNCKVRLVTL